MINLGSFLPEQPGILAGLKRGSTGFSGAERGEVNIGDTVAVSALGPIGLMPGRLTLVLERR
ncbi:hypothetical protein IF690_15185 [Pseudomonas sp. SK3(2021)]|uniref:hypothetical protein n=1 Tax=Pseudomonas sp. SK3(2021) TaxID=2841064 RepID=UPI00192C6965|nr:hypothetical protein [Pseudomonas sp. SK3(2021)]QQZ44909.1 hypothetical protein IF690_15185 [Pseudomonas sp. SK3(2021)]